MRNWKKAAITLLAVGLFLLVTALFGQMLTRRFSEVFGQVQGQSHVYRQPTIPATEAAQTQPETTVPTVPVTTAPPETLPETVPETTAPVETKPPRHYYDAVPLYDMTQYTHIRYGTGTIATEGSCIVSLAMAASYMTGHEYLPEDLAAWFADYIGNSIQWIDHVNDVLGLPVSRAANIDETISALKEGKIALVVMNPRNLFSTTQHFVVFTGLTEDGKILVNDPCGDNYEKWSVQNALETGFRRGDLTGKYAGAWIYDPAAVGEDPYIYQPQQTTWEMRYPGMELSQEDIQLMAELLWVEAQGEPFEGQQAVAEVILNRLWSDSFPETLKGVLYAEGQFLAVQQIYRAKPTHTQYEAVMRAWKGPYILDEHVVFFSQYPVNKSVWGTIGSHTFCYAY